jgi:hypothetical protein
MRARTASKTGLSLTIAPRAEKPDAADGAEEKLARHIAWGALLVSAAAIGGYFLGPLVSDPASEPGLPLVVGDDARGAAN